MDDRRFDALARALAGPSRRGLLGAALAAALAPLAAAGQGRRGPGAEGPCSPDPRKERCAKDGDCCTGLCDKGAGRCRCARSGQRCAQDRNCCDRAPGGPLTCQGDPGKKTCKPKPCAGERPPCHRCRRGVWVPDPGAAGDPCGAAESCRDGTATAAQVCDDQGACPPGAEAECAPYRCAGDVCGTTCGGDGDCAGDAYCTDAEQCAEDRAEGADCGRDEQCASGHCAQGVCCATACGGACEACNLAGSKGTCVPDPAKAGRLCEGGKVCDAEGTCAACGPGNDCPGGRCCDAETGACLEQGAACADGKVCRLGACVGNGFCGPGTQGQFACGPAACGDAEIVSEDARTECRPTMEGGLVCTGRFFQYNLGRFRQCNSSAECGEGTACYPYFGVADYQRCLPLCGSRP